MGNYEWRREVTALLKGGFVAPLQVGGTSLATLPRWGSQVRIPSSARKESQVRAAIRWP
jgi:hypothetical protein